MSPRKDRSWIKRTLLGGAALLLGIALHALATDIHAYLSHHGAGGATDPNPFWTVVFGAAVIGLAISIWAMKQWFPWNTRIRPILSKEKRAHVISLLSPLPPSAADRKLGLPDYLVSVDEKDSAIQSTDNRIVFLRDLGAFFDKYTPIKDPTKHRWPWEMPLRIWNFNSGVLRSITVICSDESYKNLDRLRELREYSDALTGVEMNVCCLTKTGELVVVPIAKAAELSTGISFEEFDQVYEAIKKCVEGLKFRGIRYGKIAIDFTGGQKPTSVAAMAFTVDRNIIGQYAQTNAPWDVVSYDLVRDEYEHVQFGEH